MERFEPNLIVATELTDFEVARILLTECAASFDIDLGFQGFDEELGTLSEEYGPPGGIMLLAAEGNAPLGCVGVRPLEWPHVAELKRLYARPRARGMGLGPLLSQEALEFAWGAGYARVRLDTLPSMATAQRLYESIGFREIDAYRFNPVQGARYMELEFGTVPTPASD